jgi:hypothetical protein
MRQHARAPTPTEALYQGGSETATYRSTNAPEAQTGHSLEVSTRAADRGPRGLADQFPSGQHRSVMIMVASVFAGLRHNASQIRGLEGIGIA